LIIADGSSIRDHGHTGWWNNSFKGPSLGGDGNFAFGMFQEPVVNCDAMVGYHGRGYYPMAARDNLFPAAHFRSILWMGGVTANMLNQLLWLYGTDGPSYGPWQQTDMAAQWASEVEELMPSLYAPFGIRDGTTASVTQTELDLPQLASVNELRARSWQENADCLHVVVINTNISEPAHFTVVLAGATAGLRGGTAKRLFDAVYSVETKAYGSDVVMFTDWLAVAHTNVYRLGTNCSDTLAWRANIQRLSAESVRIQTNIQSKTDDEKVISDAVGDDALAQRPGVPSFRVLWNAQYPGGPGQTGPKLPNSCTGGNGGGAAQQLDLSAAGITSNAGEALDGAEVTIFYGPGCRGPWSHSNAA
jgi:hypothetical protein